MFIINLFFTLRVLIFVEPQVLSDIKFYLKQVPSCWFCDFHLNNLSMSTMQYAVFGSILTVGAMLGAITSGHIADFVGRKGVRNIIILQYKSILLFFLLPTSPLNWSLCLC